MRLGPQCSSEVQEGAAAKLASLSRSSFGPTYSWSTEIAAAGAILPLVALLGPHNALSVQISATMALTYLALQNNDNQVKIAAAGAIPPLVALLGPQNSANIQYDAIGALRNLAANAGNRFRICSAGAVSALTQLAESAAYDLLRSTANAALDIIKQC